MDRGSIIKSEKKKKKTIYSEEYTILLKQLRNARERTGLTQSDLAKKLGQTQSFVSKVERGERRIDVVELMAFCRALAISFVEFTKQIERS